MHFLQRRFLVPSSFCFVGGKHCTRSSASMKIMLGGANVAAAPSIITKNTGNMGIDTGGPESWCGLGCGPIDGPYKGRCPRHDPDDGASSLEE